LEINPKAEEEKGPAFVRSFSGFSWKNPKGLSAVIVERKAISSLSVLRWSEG